MEAANIPPSPISDSQSIPSENWRLSNLFRPLGCLNFRNDPSLLRISCPCQWTFLAAIRHLKPWDQMEKSHDQELGQFEWEREIFVSSQDTFSIIVWNFCLTCVWGTKPDSTWRWCVQHCFWWGEVWSFWEKILRLSYWEKRGTGKIGAAGCHEGKGWWRWRALLFSRILPTLK